MSTGRRSIFVSGVGSDIGRALVTRYLERGFEVAGTYRTPESVTAIQGRPGLRLISCDLADARSVAAAVRSFAETGATWDTFLSCVGTEEPIGPFFDTDFDAWERSMIVNSTAQLRILHALHPHRRSGGAAHVVFFAGGGTNNPFPNYSAYCAAKILLIKMCELLDDENADLNAFIVGPGWVRTKIHDQTLRAGTAAGSNFDRTVSFLETGGDGTTHDEIFECIEWGIAQGRGTVGGRNLSIVHDAWRDGGRELAASLQTDPNLFKLRRVR